MKRFKLLIALFIILPLIFACEDTKKSKEVSSSQNQPTQIEQKVEGDIQEVEVIEQKPVVLKTNEQIQQQKKDKKILNKLGINTTNDGKIIIEPKKTKEFLENLANILKKEGEEFKKKNRGLNSQDLGIQANKDKIIIDTKKTKNFLEKLSKDLEEMAKDIEKSVDNL